MKKKYLLFILIFFSVSLYIFFKFDLLKQEETKLDNINIPITNETTEADTYSSSIMNDVTYTSLDLKGNEYIINAKEAEADISNRNVLYLKNVKAVIKLKDSKKIEIYSDYGKYNSTNYDTIFSQNVIIKYLYNKIVSEYLDFSIERNSMIISKNVEYTNFENKLKADVIEMDIKTKDTKIYMYEDKKKVNIKNKN